MSPLALTPRNLGAMARQVPKKGNYSGSLGSESDRKLTEMGAGTGRDLANSGTEQAGVQADN